MAMTESFPFFIVGSARSGTTFLRLSLNAHPVVAVPPESRFITELNEGTSEVEISRFLQRLARHPRFAAWELSIEAVEAELQGLDRVSYAGAIDATYRAYAKSHGKDRWGDKTPRYVVNIPALAELFPTARFIHLIRDGRDVALSYADVPFGPKNVAKAAELWANRVAKGIRDGTGIWWRTTRGRSKTSALSSTSISTRSCSIRRRRRRGPWRAPTSSTRM
jgi:hypothetical protein